MLLLRHGIICTQVLTGRRLPLTHTHTHTLPHSIHTNWGNIMYVIIRTVSATILYKRSKYTMKCFENNYCKCGHSTNSKYRFKLRELTEFKVSFYFSRWHTTSLTHTHSLSLSLSLYIYIYIYMYVCVCVCMYVYAYIETFYISIYLFISPNMNYSIYLSI